MKPALIAILGFMVAGCVNSQRGASLTPEQAQALAIKLANNEAYAKFQFHCQPFQDGHPAHFVAEHWVWTDWAAVGHMDLEVTVELAANGVTNRVNLQMLDNMIDLSERRTRLP